MKQGLDTRYVTTEEGYPSGGYTCAEGLELSWNNAKEGALFNGCTEETVADALVHRLDYLQTTKAKNPHYASALRFAQAAVKELEELAAEQRLARRAASGLARVALSNQHELG